MTKKRIIIIVIIILIIGLIPIKNQLKDGGSIEYRAILYKYTKIHKLSEQSSTGYEDGWELRILGVHVGGVINVYVEATPKTIPKKYIKEVVTTNLAKIYKVSDLSSSNPYTYTKNKYYDNIVSLGKESVPTLQEMLDNNEIVGLDAEIIKIAINDISK